MIKLFVYGTLRKGCHNHHYLEKAGAKFIQDYDAIGYSIRLFNFGDEGFCVPVIYAEDDVTKIAVGEVYELELTKEIMQLEQGYKLTLIHGTDDIVVYYPQYDCQFFDSIEDKNGISNFYKLSW